MRRIIRIGQNTAELKAPAVAHLNIADDVSRLSETVDTLVFGLSVEWSRQGTCVSDFSMMPDLPLTLSARCV